MKPADFPESNRIIVPSDHVYSDNITGIDALSAWSDGEQCVSLWRLSWRERLSALIFGRVWLALLSGDSQPPVYVEARRQYFKDGEEE
jgi:hypothetical protein